MQQRSGESRRARGVRVTWARSRRTCAAVAPRAGSMRMERKAENSRRKMRLQSDRMRLQQVQAQLGGVPPAAPHF